VQSRAVQEVQVLSIVCRAVFSDDCKVNAQYDFTVIHILAYVHRYELSDGCHVDGS
jgi:hypothetical protein